MASDERSGPRTVFVGGFSDSTDASLLYSTFSTFGDVVDVQLPPDPSQVKPHRGFAFLTFTDAQAALDAIDNMHLNELPGPSNKGKTLKVNTAKVPKGQTLAGSNRPIWTDENWLREHGVESEKEQLRQGAGVEGEDAAMDGQP